MYLCIKLEAKSFLESFLLDYHIYIYIYKYIYILIYIYIYIIFTSACVYFDGRDNSKGYPSISTPTFVFAALFLWLNGLLRQICMC